MIIWTDANPGMVAYVREDEECSSMRLILKRTVNEAEYVAVIYALQKSSDMSVEILSDSKLVVNQLNRKWHIKAETLRQLAEMVWEDVAARKKFGHKVTFTWIPRKENKAGKMLP